MGRGFRLIKPLISMFTTVFLTSSEGHTRCNLVRPGSFRGKPFMEDLAS